MGQRIGVLIDEEFRDEIEAGWLERVAGETLSAEGINSSAELGLVITGDVEVQKLNQSYRGVDEPTDVLAFGFHQTDEGDSLPLFVTPPDGILHLGEVIISYPQAARQAKERGYPPGREIALLVIHGILHLLGYDHDIPEQELKMRGREESILGDLSAWPARK